MRTGFGAVAGLMGTMLVASVVVAQGGPAAPLRRGPGKEAQTAGSRLQPLTSGTVGAGAGPAAITSPGSYDLTLANDLKLGGSVFKNGEVFLHNDGVANTGLGSLALDALTTGVRNTALGYLSLSANTTGFGNTAVGDQALLDNLEGSDNTAVGHYALENSVGYYHVQSFTHFSANTAVGREALRNNTAGIFNAAVGARALSGNLKSWGNTAVGARALEYFEGGGPHGFIPGLDYGSNTAVGYAALGDIRTGVFNVAVGYKAGFNLDLDDTGNIMINSRGDSGDENTLRIGQFLGTGLNGLDAAYIQGIHGRSTVDENSTVAVLIDEDGKLGTMVSAERFKDEIRDMGDGSARLLELRPVAFRYRREADAGGGPLTYGLIAEEVAEVFPELVVPDAEGRPLTVKYHLLSSLLLNELQREHRRTEALEERVEDLRAQLDALAREIRAAQGG